MTDQVFAPGPRPRTVRDAKGSVLEVPAQWELVEPGDAALTRRIKAAGDFWLVQEKKGRKTFSHGVWTDPKLVVKIRADLEKERSTESYAKKKAADAKRREVAQGEYVEDFQQAVSTFLKFHDRFRSLEEELSRRVTIHATPVGSGTVARTQRIPIEERAESAVIAWMRHQTTAYDTMKIPREKGKRREVRRMLAQRSKTLLDCYRKGLEASPSCPLAAALKAETMA